MYVQLAVKLAAPFRHQKCLADLGSPESLRQAITDSTRVVYFETPVNPTLQLIDIAAVREVVDSIDSVRPTETRITMIVEHVCHALLPASILNDACRSCGRGKVGARRGTGLVASP